jgi:hypothetical protein
MRSAVLPEVSVSSTGGNTALYESANKGIVGGRRRKPTKQTKRTKRNKRKTAKSPFSFFGIFGKKK